MRRIGREEAGAETVKEQELPPPRPPSNLAKSRRLFFSCFIRRGNALPDRLRPLNFCSVMTLCYLVMYFDVAVSEWVLMLFGIWMMVSELGRVGGRASARSRTRTARTQPRSQPNRNVAGGQRGIHVSCDH